MNDLKFIFEEQCKMKNLKLGLILDKNMPSQIHGDIKRFKQLLINLVGNAFKFTVKGGINIRMSLVDDDLT
jgi:signal transduction histidine kinase